MARFFFNPDDIENREAWVRGEEAAHAVKTLRLGLGDEITLLDGLGFEYDALILESARDGLRVKMGEAKPSSGEPRAKVTIYQGLPKLDKLELIVQKCVELGATEIVPVLFNRCVARSVSADRIERLNRIAREAAKQSRRGIAPRVASPLEFSGLCAAISSYNTSILLYELEDKSSLKRALSGARVERIAIIAGPEGGLESEEAARLAELGAQPVSLGKRILRTETAALAALSCVMYELGEMEP